MERGQRDCERCVGVTVFRALTYAGWTRDTARRLRLSLRAVPGFGEPFRALRCRSARCAAVAGGIPLYLPAMDRLWTPWRYAYVTRTPQTDAPQPGAEQATDLVPARPGVPPSLAAWPGDCGCVFCNLIAAADYAVTHGTARDEADRAVLILERGATCFLVLNTFPYNSGHLMVVPYEHAASLAGLPAATAAELMHLARRAERVLRAVYRPDGLNLGLNLGQSAGAGVAHHLHLHAVPRWSGDTNFMTVVGETRVLPEMLDDAWRRLRAALALEPLEPEPAEPEPTEPGPTKPGPLPAAAGPHEG